MREDYSPDGDGLGVLPARPRALARLPLGRGRPRAASPTTTSASASRWRSGTGAIPILKERLFGLDGREGNHGEDVKEYYFYLDSTPTHSYMKCLYKYPQAAFPYERARRGEPPAGPAARRSSSCWTRASSTTTATSTCSIEYAKAAADDILIRITAHNRGPEAAALAPAADALVPQHLVLGPRALRARALRAWAPAAGDRGRARRRSACAGSSCEGTPELLFTENETNSERLYGAPNASPYVKDGINDARRARARRAA